MAMFIMLILLIVLAVIGVPLAFSIGASALIYMQTNVPHLIPMLPQRVWGGVFSFVMIAMPLFIFAGELMNTGGITKRIINLCMYLVKPFRGGLGEVNIVSSMLFGGISGSSVADTSAIGSVMIPSMEENGYPSKFAAGVTVASSTMGMIIPPSVPMIVYAMVSGASVGNLFIAGLIPGLMIGISQLFLVFFISRKKGYHPPKTPFVLIDFLKAILSGVPALAMPVIIVVFVSFGVTTASESAGVAVFYALLVGFFVYRELTIQKVIKALKKTFIASSSIMIIIGFTTIFTWLLTMANIPTVVASFFLALDMPLWGYVILFDIIILLLGTFIDVTPAILLLSPILLPVMQSVGVSELQFGAMMITGLGIGLVTPPVGMCLNACTKINRMPILQIFKGALPFIICNIVVLVLISLVPALTTWLPSVLSY
ncbi:tripartite ATP-independent transporter DctM subunit [Natranaerovirga hydrolytica]|uniref:Tripartite ATP-independent transporter DctM subunit n=1 Tax=Natranaerovirga hydrolytica TaxID=680378 RepID=A0A4R1N6A0_9FIRM|nr:TRAP transporter large permease [Natranaerovirga hydrolytica]TCL00066.1 tripartite ATP-independent transporter DctM subunit [Natranaerovirga hydrolytica]